MKRILLAGLAALGLAAAAQPAKANFMFDYSVCRHFSFVHTQKNRCFNYSCSPTPLPGAPGFAGPAPWGPPAAYGPPPAYGYAAPAPVVAAPMPAAPAPQFKAPQPSPAPNSPAGVQQAGYFYYGPTNNAGYGYNYGYGAGYLYYGNGASYAQAPNYWY